MEGLRILVEFFGAVLIAFITFFLTRSHYERQRKDQLEDRDYNRRLRIKDIRITEARSLLDKWDAHLDLLSENLALLSYYFFLEKDKVGGADALMDELNRSMDKLSLFNNDTRASTSSLTIINDKQLIELQDLFVENILSSVSSLFEVLDKMKVGDKADVIPENELRAFSKLIINGRNILTKLELRLDEVAEKI